MTRTYAAIYLFVVLVAGVATSLLVDAGRLGSSGSGIGLGSGSAVQVTSPNSVQRLHETLGIGRGDPNQDIRTNRLLNMEGI
jgi:hypothetical protein